MVSLLQWIIIAGFIAGFPFIQHAAGETVDTHILYGPDDRKNENDNSVTDFMRSLGSSTVIIVDKVWLQKQPGGIYTINNAARTYAERHGATQCNGEPWPFAEELHIGFCSGTLITKQYISTAGHCIPDQATCESSYFVFGATNEQMAQRFFPDANIFPCESILYSYHQPYDSHTDTAAKRLFFKKNIHTPGTMQIDFAVMKLDRPVPARIAVPATVRTQGRVEMGEEVLLIGHPEGLPRKYAPSKVNFVGPMLPTGGYHWAAPFDSFGGNSGSGVFSLSTGEMVGIQVLGYQSYADESDCETSSTLNVCDEKTETRLGDKLYVDQVLTLADEDFERLYPFLAGPCMGQWQDGSTILSAALVKIQGCLAEDDCQNGGSCVDYQCNCPEGFFGADCSQARSRFVCQGVGENVDYLMCDCPTTTAPPMCQSCNRNNIVENGCYNEDEELIDGCQCHESCATCGYGPTPTDSASCIICHPGGGLVLSFDNDGTGTCVYGECYDPFLQLIDGCTCHESCAACGYGSSPTESDDCIHCKQGGTLQRIHPDGTGTCIYEDEIPGVCPLDDFAQVEWCGEGRCIWSDNWSHLDLCVDVLANTTNCAVRPKQPYFELCGASDVAFFDLLDCPTPAPSTWPSWTPSSPPSGVPSDPPSVRPSSLPSSLPPTVGETVPPSTNMPTGEDEGAPTPGTAAATSGVINHSQAWCWVLPVVLFLESISYILQY